VSKVRVCFLGTPEFSRVALEALAKDEHFEIVGVVTQPDRPAGRKMQLTPSAVKSFALAHGLKVISPESVNKDVILEEIRSWTAEVAVVVAFGQILSEKFLKLFQRGAVNIHGSILPRWRGAAPIQRAIEAGDTESGVTLQKIVKELDAGDILGIRKLKLETDLSAMDVHDQMAVLGADLLHVELMDYVRGNLAPVPQDPKGVTFAKKISKAESEIDWNRKATDLHNKIRALQMGPGTFTKLQGKVLKIHKSQVTDASGPAGTVLAVSGDELVIGCGQGSLRLLVVQPESKARMSIADFLKGRNLEKGEKLGTK
jgi:methionyl-tRNA formyltransferase